ncbi:MAG: hypothetical protein HY644_03080 [Acidobacteria bacterium]|nr:hypothetical protein [Acidobacteriota bacterium]
MLTRTTVTSLIAALTSFFLISSNALSQGNDPLEVNDVTKVVCTPSCANDDARFAQALSQAATNGKAVYVPYRSTPYTLTSTLNLSSKQHVIGQLDGGWLQDGWGASQVLMPTLKFSANLNPGAIVMGPSSSLHGLNIIFDGTPTAYAAVWIDGGAVSIRNVRIQGAYNGIDTRSSGLSCTSGYNNGRLTIANVFIDAQSNIGVHVTRTCDFSLLNDVEVWAASYSGNRVAFKFEKNDWVQITNSGVFNSGTGFQFVNDSEGGSVAVMTGSQCDYCYHDIDINGDHTVTINGGINNALHYGLYVHNNTVTCDGGSSNCSRVAVSGAQFAGDGGNNGTDGYVIHVTEAKSFTMTGSVVRKKGPYNQGNNYTAAQFRGGRDFTFVGNIVEANTYSPPATSGSECVHVDTNWTTRSTVTGNIMLQGSPNGRACLGSGSNYKWAANVSNGTGCGP